MGLAERVIESLPSAHTKLIVECTYRRARYVPARDRGRPMLARFANALAAHLLQVDAKKSPEEVAAQLECSTEKAKELIAHGEQVMRVSDEALHLVGTIRDDVYEGLERTGMHTMLGAKETPLPQCVPMPRSATGAMQVVGKLLDVEVLTMTSESRRPKETDARHIAMALVQYIHPDISRPNMGKLFGGRDHSTVIQALRRVDAAIRGIDNDPVLLAKIDLVRERLGLDSSAFHFVDKGR